MHCVDAALKILRHSVNLTAIDSYRVSPNGIKWGILPMSPSDMNKNVNNCPNITNPRVSHYNFVYGNTKYPFVSLATWHTCALHHYCVLLQRRTVCMQSVYNSANTVLCFLLSFWFKNKIVEVLLFMPRLEIISRQADQTYYFWVELLHSTWRIGVPRGSKSTIRLSDQVYR